MGVSTADAFSSMKMALGFLVRASSAASGYRKPTHVTQETMATTYPVLRMSGSGAQTAVSRKIQMIGKRTTGVNQSRIDFHWKTWREVSGDRASPFVATSSYFTVDEFKICMCRKNIQKVCELVFSLRKRSNSYAFLVSEIKNKHASSTFGV